MAVPPWRWSCSFSTYGPEWTGFEEELMRYRNLMIVGIVAPALLIGACNRRGESQEPTVRDEAANTADQAAKRQQERAEDISQLDKRVAEIEREYTEANKEVVADKKTPTVGLREELKEDVSNVKQAVGDLRTTTPENWWNRHEQAMRRTADDIEADVARLAGQVKPAAPRTTEDARGETVSTAPFTSQRDEFVEAMHVRVDAMKQALDKVKASGPKETEVEDVRARINKLGDDVDRLKSASPDDWWDVTKARVTEYVDRVDRSVNRLDDRG
jgi:chromosome segregation ATPase